MADEINQRLDRIETALAGLATKADLAELRAEAKADLAALRSEMAGFAKGADITLLQQRVVRAIGDAAHLRTLHNLEYSTLALQVQQLGGLTRVPDLIADVVTLLHEIIDRLEPPSPPPSRGEG